MVAPEVNLLDFAVTLADRAVVDFKGRLFVVNLIFPPGCVSVSSPQVIYTCKEGVEFRGKYHIKILIFFNLEKISLGICFE